MPSDYPAGLWRAPASGTPLKPSEVAEPPSVAEIVGDITSRIAVPQGPTRTVILTLGLVGGAISPNALNQKIVMPLLGAPGKIASLDFEAALITTGAAAGLLQLADVGDSNSPMMRQFIVNVGAAGTWNVSYASGTSLPFLGGIVITWIPLVAGFGASLINMNIDYNSIPIGQRD